MTDPTGLPRLLLDEAPTTKFLYLWLLPQGRVGYTVRGISEATGLAYKSVSDGLARLRTLKLLHTVVEATGNQAGVYYVKASLTTTDLKSVSCASRLEAGAHSKEIFSSPLRL